VGGRGTGAANRPARHIIGAQMHASTPRRSTTPLAGWPFSFLSLSLVLAAILSLGLSGSAAALEVRQVAVTANDILYEKVSGRLYVSVPGSSTTYPNCIVVIDPATASIESWVWVGSEPNRLAASDDGQYLYVGLDGAGAVRRVHIPSRTADLQFSLGLSSGKPNQAVDIAVLPGQPASVALVRGPSGGSTSVAIYDDGIQRPVAVNGPGAIAFGPDASRLFGFDTGSSSSRFSRMSVTANGLTVLDSADELVTESSKRIYYVEGRVFSSSGDVVDPENLRRLGQYRPPAAAIRPVRDVAVDASAGLAFALSGEWNEIAGGATPVFAFGVDTFDLRWTLPIPGAATSWISDHLVRWPGGVALRTYTGQVFVVDLSASAMLTLSNYGLGRGQVSATDLEMTCGVDCVRLVPYGTTVTLTANADAGSTFTGWVGSADCSDGIVTMAGARTCVAVFRNLTFGLGTAVSLPANDLAYSASTGKIYASVPGSDPLRGNTITEIEPDSVALGASIWVGSEPNRLALADDGRTLYVGLDGAGAIRRVDVGTMTPLGQFWIGRGYTPSEFAVLPGDPDSVAVVRSQYGGTAVFSNGVARPVTTSGLYTPRSLAFSASATRLYGADSYRFYRMNVDSNGVTLADTNTGLGGSPIHFAAGRLFADSGAVLDPEAPALLGTFPVYGLSSRFIAPSPAADVAFVVGDTTDGAVARRYDPSAFTLRDSVTLPGTRFPAGSLLVTGSNRLAFRATNWSPSWWPASVVLFTFDQPATCTIVVESSGTPGAVTIDVASPGAAGAGAGATPFERTFAPGTGITLTAPATAEGQVFYRWYRDGTALYTTSRTLNVNLAAGAVFTAAYRDPPPSVAAVTPSTGPLSGGTTITISGAAFAPGAMVQVGFVAATSVVVVNPTTITAVTPAAAANGRVIVTVFNPDGRAGGLPNAFTYAAIPGSFSKLLPADAATGSGGATALTWTASADVARYEFCVDSTLNGSCDGNWISVGVRTREIAGPLAALTTYEWQVRAVNAAGTTEADGGWRRFTVAADTGCAPGTSVVLARPTGAGIDGMWQPTGITALAGSPLSLIVAPGLTWTKDGTGWTADGNASDVGTSVNAPLPGAPRMSLVARIGPTGVPFVAGGQYQAPVASSGQVYLAPNDEWYLTWGNSDALPVTVCPGQTPCSVEATATVPPTAAPGVAVAFGSTATAASTCGSAETYDWDFGDGSAHDATAAPTHAYAAAGTYTWTLVAGAGTATKTLTGTIVVSAPGSCVPATVAVQASTPSTPGGQWQSTGITVGAGESLTITAPGTWTRGGQAWTAAGDSGDTGCGVNCAAAGAPRMALIGRIGPGGAPFVVGASYQQTAPAGGTLYLAPNDDWYMLWNNAGSLSVAVCHGAAAAACSVEATAGVPPSGTAGSSVAFAATGSATSSCGASPTFDWDFGDGSAHAQTAAASHVYASAGTYAWMLTASAGSATTTRTGTVVVSAAGSCVPTIATVSASLPAVPGGQWQSTGVTIGLGDALTITAPGTWTRGGQSWTSAGNAADTTCSVNCPLPGAPRMALVGRIGPTGTPFLVGATYQQPATEAGTLYLAPNDDWYMLWGDSGALSVAVCHGAATCSVSATATVPPSGMSSFPIGFSAAGATAAGCGATPTYDWDFGDGSAHAATASVEHTYAVAGKFTWTLTVTAGTETRTRTGTIVVSAVCSATSVVVQASRAAVPNGQWQATGVTVSWGHQMAIAAPGTWMRAGQGWTAAGNAADTTCGVNCPLPGAPRMALVGRIGTSGTPFLVGTSFQQTATSYGTLYLAPNDDWYMLWNNAGSLAVSACSIW
jgi:PKD repeat protein